MQELTQEQLERQDYVVNAIYNCINNLIPEKKNKEWYNLELVGKVRDVIQDVIVNDLHLCTEQEFYPYLEEEAEKPKLPDEISIIWHIDDIQEAIDKANECRDEEEHICLSDNEKRKVLQNVFLSLDANFGVNWDTIDDHINDYLHQKRNKK